MKSSKKEYRVVTAWGGKFSVQTRDNGSDNWYGGWPNYETVNEAMMLIGELIARDDFVPEVVEV